MFVWSRPEVRSDVAVQLGQVVSPGQSHRRIDNHDYSFYCWPFFTTILFWPRELGAFSRFPDYTILQNQTAVVLVLSHIKNFIWIDLRVSQATQYHQRWEVATKPNWETFVPLYIHTFRHFTVYMHCVNTKWFLTPSIFAYVGSFSHSLLHFSIRSCTHSKKIIYAFIASFIHWCTAHSTSSDLGSRQTLPIAASQ